MGTESPLTSTTSPLTTQQMSRVSWLWVLPLSTRLVMSWLSWVFPRLSTVIPSPHTYAMPLGHEAATPNGISYCRSHGSTVLYSWPFLWTWELGTRVANKQSPEASHSQLYFSMLYWLKACEIAELWSQSNDYWIARSSALAFVVCSCLRNKNDIKENSLLAST